MYYHNLYLCVNMQVHLHYVCVYIYTHIYVNGYVKIVYFSKIF